MDFLPPPAGSYVLQAIQRAPAGRVVGASRFDLWRYRGERDALTVEEQAGFALFSGKAGCTACHAIGERHALFSDFRHHNTGIGWRQSFGCPATVTVEPIPGVRAAVDRHALDTYSEPPANDVGRFEITLVPADRWAYRAPLLGNVAVTRLYVHDGSLGTLEDVIHFYDRGGIDDESKSPLRVLGLSTGRSGPSQRSCAPSPATTSSGTSATRAPCRSGRSGPGATDVRECAHRTSSGLISVRFARRMRVGACEEDPGRRSYGALGASSVPHFCASGFRQDASRAF